jgi:hypothetical protein
VQVFLLPQMAYSLQKGGTADWLELSWKNELTEEFIDHVSTVLCSYSTITGFADNFGYGIYSFQKT